MGNKNVSDMSQKRCCLWSEGAFGQESRGDLRVWALFLECFNGRAFWMPDAVQAFDIELFTYAAGSISFGSFCRGHWCFAHWLEL